MVLLDQSRQPDGPAQRCRTRADKEDIHIERVTFSHLGPAGWEIYFPTVIASFSLAMYFSAATAAVVASPTAVVICRVN